MADYIATGEGGRVTATYPADLYPDTPTAFESQREAIAWEREVRRDTGETDDDGEPVTETVREPCDPNDEGAEAIAWTDVDEPTAWERHPALPDDAVDVDADTLAAIAALEAGGIPAAWVDGEAVAWKRPRTVEGARDLAIAAVEAFAARARVAIADTDEPAKLAIYARQAVLAPAVIDGTATSGAMALARESAARLHAAGRIPDDAPETAARAWMAMDDRLLGLSAEIETTRAEVVAAIERRRTPEGVDEAVALALDAAEARLTAVLAPSTNGAAA